MKKTPADPKQAKADRKEHRAHVRIVIETYEWLLECRSRPPMNVPKVTEMIAEMAKRAKESPEDYGRWANIEARFHHLQKSEL